MTTFYKVRNKRPNTLVLTDGMGETVAIPGLSTATVEARFISFQPPTSAEAEVTALQVGGSGTTAEPALDLAPLSRTRESVLTVETLLPSDNAGILILDNSAAITLNLPANLQAGFTCFVIQQGTGIISFVTASGANLQNRGGYTKTAGQFAQAGLTVVRNNDGGHAIYNLGGDCTT